MRFCCQIRKYIKRRLGLPGGLADTKLTCTFALRSTYHCRANKCYFYECRLNCTLSIRLPGEQVPIYPAAMQIIPCYKPYSLVYNKPYYLGRRNNSLGLCDILFVVLHDKFLSKRYLLLMERFSPLGANYMTCIYFLSELICFWKKRQNNKIAMLLGREK